jgi:hypothetical protein
MALSVKAKKRLGIAGAVTTGVAAISAVLFWPKKASAAPSRPAPGQPPQVTPPEPPPAPPIVPSSGNQPPADCQWVPSTSDPAAVTLAMDISYHDDPIAWVDGHTYGPVQINGNWWRFVMGWGINTGKRTKDVRAEKCQ